jgi:hypothetical protein
MQVAANLILPGAMTGASSFGKPDNDMHFALFSLSVVV